MEKLFILAALLGTGYVVINILVFWINAKSKEKQKERLYEARRKKIEPKEPKKNINYDAVMANTNKPLEYYEAKDLFNSCIKNKLMNREQILYLKSIINNTIPEEHMRLYKIKYKNDAHEIYCKLKSSFIDEGTYNRIIEYLTMIQDN